MRISLIIKLKNYIPIVIASTAAWSLTTKDAGMAFESSLVNYSIDRGILLGFIFPDPIRPFTSASYHIATQISLFASFGQGSYFVMQCTYIFMIVLRSVILFEILRKIRVLPNSISLLVVILLSIYPVDGATLWIGQMNQIWATTLALGSLYLLISFLQSCHAYNDLSLQNIFKLTWSTSLAFIAIWSYDTIAIALAISSVSCSLLIRPTRFSRQVIGFYLILPSIYCFQYSYHFLASADPYRNSLISESITANKVINNLIWMLTKSFEVFNGFETFDKYETKIQILILAIAIVCSIFVFFEVKNESIVSVHNPKAQHLIFFVLLSFCLYAPFAILNDSRSLWRTHLISALPVSLTVGFIVFAITRKLSQKIKQMIIPMLCLFLLVVNLPSQIERGSIHLRIWENHKHFVTKLESVLFCGFPTKGLLIVVPPDDSTSGNSRSPIGDNYWLKETLKLQYDLNGQVIGYLSSGGILGPGVNVEELKSLKVKIILLDPKMEKREFENLISDLKSKGIETTPYSCEDTIPRNRMRWYN